MRAAKLSILALTSILGLAPAAARADHQVPDFVAQDGTRYRWVAARVVVEKRLVTIPGRFEVRHETVVEPGRWETRTKQVFVPGPIVHETRTRVIPGRFVIRHGSVRWDAPRTICENVAVQKPGRYETVCEKVWVPGCSRVVERKVWIPERTECQEVRVEKPGYWERVCR